MFVMFAQPRHRADGWHNGDFLEIHGTDAPRPQDTYNSRLARQTNQKNYTSKNLLKTPLNKRRKTHIWLSRKSNINCQKLKNTRVSYEKYIKKYLNERNAMSRLQGMPRGLGTLQFALRRVPLMRATKDDLKSKEACSPSRRLD